MQATVKAVRAPEGGSITDPVRRRLRRPIPLDGLAQAGAASQRGWMDRWMALLRAVGNVQAWVVLSLFYVAVIAPIGAIFRLCADPLRLRRRDSTWQPLPRQYARPEEAAEQF